MEKQHKTFLSYSRVNKDFAVRMAKELKAEGLPVWLDQLDIPPGSRWDVEVEKALVECDIFMVIITQASSTSENVLDEIGYAIDNGKRMLPVLLEKTNIPLRLRRFQYVDFTDKNFDDGIQSAKELLRNLIAQPTVPRKVPPEEPRDQLDQAERDRLARQQAEKEQSAKANAEIVRLQEKADLEKIEALRRPKNEMQPAPAKHWSKFIGIFGFSILVILIVGYAITRFLSGPASVEVPIGTRTPTEDVSMSTSAALVVPVTADDSSTPIMEAPTATESPAAAETPTDAATMTASAPLSEIIDGKGAEMVLVPEGDFMMGSNRGESDEQPSHVVFLDAFYIDKFEVTNRLYKACVDNGKCDPPRQTYFFAESPNRLYFDNPQYDNFPVIYVDWNMAKAYCEWRDARLPTEAEWEKAARGPEGNTYPWGGGLDCQKANYQNCVNRTSEVGIYEDGKSPYGVYDMTGNVWEWVADWYSENYYAISPRNNPTGPIVGQSRVLRGGSWPRFDVTAYHRNNFGANYNTFDIGFRCASDVTP
jgi:formylglycine-generating enzyme required for sulfatase activity